MTEIPNVSLETQSDTILATPDRSVKVREAFGIDSDMEVPAFSEADERVPDLDPAYVFDPDTTMAITALPNRPYRTGGGPAKLAADPYQPRCPYQPRRPRRPRRHRFA